MTPCPRCGSPAIVLSRNDSCTVCGGTMSCVAHSPFDATLCGESIPWESPISREKPVQTILATLLRSFSQSTRFFAAASRVGDIRRPLVYALFMGNLGVLATVFWEYVSPFSIHSMLVSSGIAPFSANTISPVTLITAPLAILLQVFLLATYCHGLLHVTKSKKRPFRSTFSVVCYAQGASVFQLIPIAGVFLAWAMGLYLLVTGIRESHGVGRLKTVLLLTLPPLLLVVVSMVIATLFLIGMALSDTSRFDPFSFFRF